MTPRLSPLRYRPSTIHAPIRGYSRKGFIVGWIAIVLLVSAGFTLATRPFTHSGLDLRFAGAVSATAFMSAPTTLVGTGPQA